MSAAILLVEDSPILGPLLASMLKASGHHEVLFAPDAPEALTTAAGYCGEISLMVTDVGLPSKRGDVLARELTALYPHMRVLLISGYTDERGRPADAPASWRTLEKPFTIEGLLAAVERSLADA